MATELRGIAAGGKHEATDGWLRALAIQLILTITLAVAEVLRLIDLRYLRLDESGVQSGYAHDAEFG